MAGGSLAPIAGFPGSPRLRVPRFIPGRRFLCALWRADALLMAGGGVVNDYWPTLIPRYLSWVVLARLLGTRVVWMGVGIGPVRGRFARRLAGIMLRLSHLVAVRDAVSAATVTAIAPQARVLTIPDPAFFNDIPEGSATPRGIGIVLRGPVPGEEAHLSQLATAVADLLAKQPADEHIALLSMHAEADSRPKAALRAACQARGVPMPEVRTLPLDPGRAMQQLAGYATVVSVRLHGLILAAIVDRPCVPVVYDPKVATAAEELGVGDLAIPISLVSGERLATALATAVSVARRVRLAEHVAERRSQRERVSALMLEAIRG